MQKTPAEKGKLLAIKLLVLGFLVLILQIPILQIASLLTDRATRRVEAETEVSKMSGTAQKLTAALLRVPYSQTVSGELNNQSKGRVITGDLYLLPQKLRIDAVATLEPRNRGIFEIMTYVTKAKISGTFVAPESGFEKPGTVLDWSSAQIELAVQDSRFIRDVGAARWDGAQLKLNPGGSWSTLGQAVHAKLPSNPLSPTSEHTFEVLLTLSGSQMLTIVPAAREWQVMLNSNHADPSFSGNILPVSRSVTSDGFSATWTMSALGNELPDSLFEQNEFVERTLKKNSVGVTFLKGIDAHRMIDRSLKYQILFIFLTFLVFFTCEIMYNFRIHPVQYLLVGTALTIFYLLVLSLSDHLSFGPAYALATLVAVGLITAYSAAILHVRKRAYATGAFLAGLYGFLYMLLVEQDSALLLGSVGLTAVLGLVMYLTRNINWYDLENESEQPGVPSGTTTAN